MTTTVVSTGVAGALCIDVSLGCKTVVTPETSIPGHLVCLQVGQTRVSALNVFRIRPQGPKHGSIFGHPGAQRRRDMYQCRPSGCRVKGAVVGRDGMKSRKLSRPPRRRENSVAVIVSLVPDHDD